MRIAVTAKGAGLGAWLDADFARSLQIVIVGDDDRFEAWPNPFRTVEGNAAGLDLARRLLESGVNALITGDIAPEAQAMLEQAGVRVQHAERGSVLELVEAFRAAASIH